jgi:HAD superfamily hydrolase (TIGR01509 family)
MLRALIFDVDGTIAETEEAHREAFNQAFQDLRLGWRWEPALYRELLQVTGGRERLQRYVRSIEQDSAARIALERRIPEIHAHKTKLLNRMIRAGAAERRPGVARLVDEARRAGLALAIATTTSMVNLETLFEATWSSEALGWFSVIAAGDMVKQKKPASDVYELALEKLGLAPEECVALEDSRNGLLAAEGAGVAAVITVSRYTADESFGGALAVLSDMGEPDAPFVPLGGAAAGPGVLTLDLLRAWLAAARDS